MIACLLFFIKNPTIKIIPPLPRILSYMYTILRIKNGIMQEYHESLNHCKSVHIGKKRLNWARIEGCFEINLKARLYLAVNRFHLRSGLLAATCLKDSQFIFIFQRRWICQEFCWYMNEYFFYFSHNVLHHVILF